MSYIDGLVFAVPKANRQAFIDYAKRSDSFLDGHTRIGYGWEDELPKGQITDFRKSVLAKDDEAIVFCWVEWPDKSTRDQGHQKMRERLESEDSFIHEITPFDETRMIFAGFDTIIEI